MNKLILAVGILALAVSGANTALLLQMGAKSKEAAEKAESVAKAIEKVQPMLQSLSDKAGAIPAGKPPLDLPDLKGKRPGDGSSTGEPEPKLPIKPAGPPLPPGPFPNK